MRSTIRQIALSAVAALAVASVAPAAWAQAQGAARPTPDQMHAKMQAMREAHERQHAQDLRTILRLRPDQEAALTAFLASHKRPARAPGDHKGPPGEAGMAMTTPQRLDQMAKREAERTGMEQRHAEALRTFYGALSPEQKQVFDALQRMNGHGHRHGGWGHRGFGGPGQMRGGPGGGPPPRDD